MTSIESPSSLFLYTWALPLNGGEVTRSLALHCQGFLGCLRNSGEPLLRLGRAARSGGLCERLLAG